jgi:flagellar biosynthesis chaperone FliJ
MRQRLLLLCLAPCLYAATGCASTSSYVHSDTTLGRVVVYRNGIAYFERTARVEGDSLQIKVPADKVDDFLKSLSVVDAKTGQPAPVAYPTAGQGSGEESPDGLIKMKITLNGDASHDLRLSYVTEAPSWKPRYRVMLGKDGKVNLEAAAIVDNTSGEDWQNVQLGVGSSSALSFRYDLRSVRLVQRETLRQTDLFAQAPPMGGPTYAQTGGAQQAQGGQRLAFELTDDTLAANARVVVADKEVVLQSRGGKDKKSSEAPAQAGAAGRANRGPSRVLEHAPPPQPQAPQPSSPLDAMARTINSSSKSFVVEGYADANDGDKYAASLERANRARDQLIRSGVDPNRIVAVGSGEKAGKKGGVSIVEADGKPEEKPKTEIQLPAQAVGSDPIGASHFESKARMTVPRGSSAMVSILSTDTEGEVVYFFDAESPRGNATYPFRAVRIKNPTDSALESGPVTVFGEGKFIGEGMSEPIPARSVAFIPFALDRQIVVEKKDEEHDKIARILTVQRGVFSTEVQHTRRRVLTLVNRLAEKATVYVRHTVAEGYKLTKAPEKRDRLGNAYLFRVDVEPGGKADLAIEEATPLFKSTDIRSNAGMEQVSVYLSSAAVEGPLKAAVTELLRLHKEMANTEQQIQTTREQMEEYRARMDELHAQLVTLKAVKTAGPLMANLEKKLGEVSDKLSKATIDLVALQEKLMVARIKFQDGVADLSMEKKPEPAPAKT